MNYTLPGHCLNSIQRASIAELLKLAKQAHKIDVKLRINGEDRWFQADWLKSLTPNEVSASDQREGT